MDKQQLVEAMWSNGKSFDRYIKDELNSFRANVWRNLIQSHLPQDNSLHILDIGTGPGFFSCILSQAGHMVTGIDSSGSMLECAKENAIKAGVTPKFIEMDSHKLAFKEETFDLVVSRNVTWTLHNPLQAYQQWMRVLKPGGKILIFDANWHMQFFDEDIAKQVEKNEREYFETYGKEFKICDDHAFIKTELPLSGTWRPKWDMQTLTDLGFMHIDIAPDIGDIVYADWEKKLYSTCPLFMISAIKPGTVSPCHMVQHRREHLQTIEKQIKAETWAELVCNQFPINRKLKVLNVKTGTGYLATTLAELGHEVFSIDTNLQTTGAVQKNALEKDDCSEPICTQNIPTEQEMFDVVIHGEQLAMEDCEQERLKQWRSLLKEDGYFIYFKAFLETADVIKNDMIGLGFELVESHDISKLNLKKDTYSQLSNKKEFMVVARKHSGSFYPY